MSKGWNVKVETNVIFTVDTNVGVVASTEEQAAREAVSFVDSNLDCHGENFKEVLERVLPSELNMGGMEWNRGSMSGDIDFDTMQVVIIEPDPDFDPDEDEDQGPSTDVLSLMEAAQCLNEAYHNLPEDHPLKHWQIIYGIAEVRDQLSKIAVYCDMTHRVMHEEQGYDDCFDFDFVPQFLENCVADDFEVKSTDPHILSMYWSAF